uniref:Vacuolar protein sorting-associated protein 35 n=1 Tax=Noctiluca scintillans TaxID=2966 RepID=A0A7S1APQ6_NOCSC|mmetsp:Transcript_5407/g.15469  ORF Transcript_5407/g.15469 Transcript_5407/m.15469 type:complete len:818 (+) Transcript_5407:75-2528(+)|eukprot:CAMPEP_0194496754 /NCGR_PEP_ID=MMETSP0253-20130528/13917_1 /TAXON_ID=2966 /ORGANISM="Noctiluca scintillans" /LENGTH=817 /DNA_ID=CAMNT_0039338183 /DNA_START=75 /DNA_END=2528 /DNA_ORIENTATION=-
MAQSNYIGNLDDQDRLLDEATAVVKEQAFHMKRAIDSDNLRDALKHSSNMICELRTSLLSPKTYYELYMQVFNEMQHLAVFFGDRQRHGRKMSDLYESVQHAGNILPRLYLVVAVAKSYIESRDAPSKEILKDASELCKGVQHPMRGLFLRYFLSQQLKDMLPDTGSVYEQEGGGDINDAFEFILNNFMETNKLWVRLQNQGPAKDKQRREKERHDLRVLVGANLVRMSQLEGMTLSFYTNVALPQILEHVVTVKDTMSQQYLFDCIIQVFPDEFKIQTLDQLLAAFSKANPTVDMKPIFTNLMDRLSKFIEENADDPAIKELDIFALFKTHTSAILERTLNAVDGVLDILPPLELQSKFMAFTLSLYPFMEHVDIILGSTNDILEQYFTKSGGGRTLNGQAGDSVVSLLVEPLKHLSLDVIGIENYSKLTNTLVYAKRKALALQVVGAVLEKDVKLESTDAVSVLFNLLSPLIKDQHDTPHDEGSDPEAFAQEQQQVCKLVHQVQTDDPDLAMQMLTIMRSGFGEGGPQRISWTLQPLVFKAMSVVKLLKNREQQVAAGLAAQPSVSLKKIFQFLHKTNSALVSVRPDVALQQFLVAASVANKADLECGQPGSFEAICFEFLTQALICFEEELSDSRQQFKALHQIVGTMTVLTCLEPENYETVVTKAVQHSSRLLKKPLQCRAIAKCSHVFWSPACMDGKRVMECLTKCLKIVNGLGNAADGGSSEVGLWIEMLDEYLYFYQSGVPELTAQKVENLIQLCASQVEYAVTSDSSASAAGPKSKAHLNRVLQMIKAGQSLEQQGLSQGRMSEINLAS